MIVRKKIMLNSNDPAFHLELVLPRWLGRRLTISKLMICHKKKPRLWKIDFGGNPGNGR